MLNAVLALVGVSILIAVHLLARRLWPVEEGPRSSSLSIAGGAATAYVFVHLLPELAAAQQEVADAAPGVVPWLERHAYLLALVGLAVFYGLEGHARASGKERDRTGRGEDAVAPVALLAFLVFAAYNFLIGYLLFEAGEDSTADMVLFGVAMGVHLVVIDHALRRQHREAYRHVGRWLLSAGLLAGWAAGLTTEFSDAALGLGMAFLAGGIILNTLKEELPEDRRSRFGYFALGAGAYSALLLAL